MSHTMQQYRVLRGQHSVEREREQKAQRVRKWDRAQSIASAVVIVAFAFVLWWAR